MCGGGERWPPWAFVCLFPRGLVAEYGCGAEDVGRGFLVLLGHSPRTQQNPRPHILRAAHTHRPPPTQYCTHTQTPLAPPLLHTHATRTTTKVAEVVAAVSAQAAAIGAVKEDAEADLAAAKPALDEALAALNQIEPKHIQRLCWFLSLFGEGVGEGRGRGVPLFQ